jgi:hypothetical protein
MLMPYMGALKAWLYAPILAVCRTSAYSVRIPVLLIGSVTIWLFFLFMRRTVGDRAALIGTALLATDPTFLLTTCFDWGPVALQHFLLVAGVLLLLTGRGIQSPSRLALAFFLLGLGTWDKVVFAWPLMALAVASTIVFPRLVAGGLKRRRVIIAATWFCLGCLPLIKYNVANPLITLRTNVWGPGTLASQFRFLRLTLEGSPLFGWLNFLDAGPHPATAHGILHDASAWLNTATRHPQRTLLWPAFLAALVITVILWITQRRVSPESAPRRTQVPISRDHSDDRVLGLDGISEQRRRRTTAHGPAVATATVHHRNCFCRNILQISTHRWRGLYGGSRSTAGKSFCRQRILHRVGDKRADGGMERRVAYASG